MKGINYGQVCKIGVWVKMQNENKKLDGATYAEVAKLASTELGIDISPSTIGSICTTSEPPIIWSRAKARQPKSGTSNHPSRTLARFLIRLCEKMGEPVSEEIKAIANRC